MADYDRGAYTPQTDAPLAFDPRRPSERRPMPMALIGSAVVLVVLLAGVAMVYRSGVRHAGEAPRPVGEPVMSVKSAPAPDADATKTPPANLDVYNETAAAPAVPSAASTVAAAGSAPAFTPPPEQPAARPAPKPETLAMLAKPPPTQAARPTPAERAAVTPAPVAAAPLKPVAQAQASTQAKPQKIAKLDQSEVAEAGMTRASAATVATNDESSATINHPPRPPVPAAASAGDASGDPTGSVVQIGAFSSDALAHKGYADMSTAMGGQMAGKVRHIQPLQRDGKTLYRTWVSGFASHADARAFCDALKAKGKTCITKG
jgi:hypothetical protein